MLKISKPLGLQKVCEYYRFEYGSPDQAYYSEGQQLVGEWHGRLAAEFGLLGAVDEQQYNRLATGQHPWTGEQLIRHRPPTQDGPTCYARITRGESISRLSLAMPFCAARIALAAFLPANT